MLKWHTPIFLEEESFKIKHYMGLMTMGSCFSEHIKNKLSLGKFSVQSNPFGILYNPVSIAASLERLLNLQQVQPHDLFFHEGLYRHPEMHSSLAGIDRDEVAAHLNSVIQSFHVSLLSAKVLIITTGTAYVHINKETGLIVGNNHKLPASDFNRRMLTSDEIVATMSQTIQLLRLRNPELHVIFTVSPIRHLKDGMVSNAHSKAILLDAAHRLQNQLENTSYFPAFEIMMDDLREYRFYEQDLVHPNQIAIDYIWEKFQSVYFDDSERKMMDEFLSIRQAMQHRLLHPESIESKLFRAAQYQKLTQLKATYPDLNWEEELDYFNDHSSEDSSSSSSGSGSN